MTPEETFGQLLGLGKSWRVVESRFEAESSTFFLDTLFPYTSSSDHRKSVV